MAIPKETLRNIHTFLTRKGTFTLTGQESKALTVAIVQLENELNDVPPVKKPEQEPDEPASA